MKRRTFLLRLLPILACLLTLSASAAKAQLPTGDFLMTWAGTCHDSTGTPLASGDLEIRIFDVVTGGSLLYSSGDDFLDAITDGTFEICLGCVTGLNLDLVNRHYLELDVNGEEIIGDAASGRLEFYPAAGDHSRPELENRLYQLELLLGIGGGFSSGGNRTPGDQALLAQAGEQLRSGLLGQGTVEGTGLTYATLGNFLWQPAGKFQSAHYSLFLGPYYLTGTGSGTEGCCGVYTGGITGNANCSNDGKLTLSDISRLIDFLYISKADLCCYASGNTNGSWDDGDCKITLSDISKLIDALYISKQPPADCMPECER